MQRGVPGKAAGQMRRGAPSGALLCASRCAVVRRFDGAAVRRGAPEGRDAFACQTGVYVARLDSFRSGAPGVVRRQAEIDGDVTRSVVVRPGCQRSKSHRRAVRHRLLYVKIVVWSVGSHNRLGKFGGRDPAARR